MAARTRATIQTKAAKRPQGGDLPAGFEETMRELTGVIEALESGELGLEAAVALFERGVALQRHGEQQLQAARLRVEEMLPDGRTATLDLDDDED